MLSQKLKAFVAADISYEVALSTNKVLGFRWSEKVKIMLETLSFLTKYFCQYFSFFSIFIYNESLPMKSYQFFKIYKRFYKEWQIKLIQQSLRKKWALVNNTGASRTATRLKRECFAHAYFGGFPFQLRLDFTTDVSWLYLASWKWLRKREYNFYCFWNLKLCFSFLKLLQLSSEHFTVAIISSVFRNPPMFWLKIFTMSCFVKN